MNIELFRTYTSSDFDSAVETVKKQFDSKVRECESLRKKVNEYNQADEIAKRDAEIKNLWKRSLLVMSENEAEAKKVFTLKHYEMHKPMRTDTYIFTLTGTGIGTAIKIKCPICGVEEDITDTESW